jgi:SAM-dependent methyltransferase
MKTQSAVEDFYATLRYPGPDALITYLWANRLAPYVPQGPFTFLDAGCGSGRHTAGMLDRYKQAHAVCLDVSQPSLDAAAALLEAKGFAGRADLRKGSYLDAVDLPEPVDLALAIGTIHHCPDPAHALANIAAAVKPGGYVACMVYGSRGHLRRYELKEALGMLTRDYRELERLHGSYESKYRSRLDQTPRMMLADMRNRASHRLSRLLGRKRHGYRAVLGGEQFLRDEMMNPIDVAFDTFGIRALVEGAGLTIVAMLGVGRHDKSLLPRGWEAGWEKLDFWQRTRLSELIDPAPKSWSFIARRSD